MNICIISKYASSSKYGFVTRHFYFAKHFQESGHNCVVITSDSNHLIDFPQFRNSINYEIYDGIKTFILKTFKYKKASGIGRIFSWIHFEWRLLMLPGNVYSNPDIIIISSLSLLTILNGYRLKKKFNCKLVFEVRDIWPLSIIEIGKFSKNNLLVIALSLIEKFGYKKSDYIIGTMPNLKEHIETILNREISNCYFIPHGIDLNEYNNLESVDFDYVNKYVPKNKFIVCYAGTIGKANALETLLKVSSALENNNDIHFLFIGEGDMLEEFKDKYASNKNVTFAPKVKKNKVQSILSFCDILYLSAGKSNLYKYGLSSNKLIDYMYSGKPIITSYSGFKSIAEEAGACFALPSEDLNALLKTILYASKMSKFQLSNMGLKGRKWLISNRSYPKLALDYLNVFKN